MSLLDDENILIEKTRESADLSVMLDAVLGDYKITGSILTKSGDDLFKTLPCFVEYEWTRYSDRLAMIHINTRRAVLVIDFYRTFQYHSLNPECGYMIDVVIYSDYCTFDIYNSFKTLFKLDDESMWDCKYIKTDVLKQTIYKKIKCN